jgi:hypothetical protein
MESAPGLERIHDFALGPLPVVRMHAGEEIVERASEVARLYPVDFAKLLRPRQLPLQDVPRPASDVGEALRFGQMDPLLSVVRLDRTAFLDLPLQRLDRLGKSLSALLNSKFKFVVGASQPILGTATDRHVRAQRQTWDRRADDECQ